VFLLLFGVNDSVRLDQFSITANVSTASIELDSSDNVVTLDVPMRLEPQIRIKG
jgi:hypothetical protein